MDTGCLEPPRRLEAPSLKAVERCRALPRFSATPSSRPVAPSTAVPAH